MKVPDGYESSSDSSDEPDELDDGPAPFAVPEGYERTKRPPMLRGREHLCHNCYNKGLGFIDTVCPACLESLKQLTRIRLTIGKKYPKALEMSLPALMLGLFKALVREREH